MTTNKPEPVAWQYRWRAVRDDGTLGDWNEWQPGRAPKMRTNVYQQQERALYAHPSPVDEAVRRDAERYRWLRERWGRVTETYDGDSGRITAIGTEPGGEGWEIEPETLDAAIDAALAKVGDA